MTKARDVSSRGGLTQVIPTSVAVGSGSGSVGANGAVTFSGVTSVAIDGCFTSNFDFYKAVIIINEKLTSTAQIVFKLRASGSTISTGYRYQSVRTYGASAIETYPSSLSTTEVISPGSVGTGQMGHWNWEIYNPALATRTNYIAQWYGFDNTNSPQGLTQGEETASSVRDGFVLSIGAGTMSGKIKIYGYNNG